MLTLTLTLTLIPAMLLTLAILTVVLVFPDKCTFATGFMLLRSIKPAQSSSAGSCVLLRCHKACRGYHACHHQHSRSSADFSAIHGLSTWQ